MARIIRGTVPKNKPVVKKVRVGKGRTKTSDGKTGSIPIEARLPPQPMAPDDPVLLIPSVKIHEIPMSELITVLPARAEPETPFQELISRVERNIREAFCVFKKKG